MVIETDLACKLYKLYDLPKTLNDSFKSTYYPCREIIVDEQMMAAKYNDKNNKTLVFLYFHDTKHAQNST